MRQKAGPQKPAAEQVIKDIRRATRKHHSAEDKIRIVLEGLRGEESIAALCRREGIAESLYYSWSEAGKKWLAGRQSILAFTSPGFLFSMGAVTTAKMTDPWAIVHLDRELLRCRQPRGWR